MKDDNLPNIFSNSEDEKELSLDEIMAADAKDSENEDKLINKQRKKKTTKKLVIIGAGVALTCSIAAGMLILDPFGSGFKSDGNDESNPSVTQTADPKEMMEVDPKDLISTEEDFATGSKRFPIKTDEWQEIRAADQDTNDLRQSIVETYAGSGLASSSGTLPSEAAGYTSDQSKKMNEDGSLNPAYSFWTSESFVAEVGEYTERLINPVFGGWDLYQYSAYPASQFFDVNLLADMFTSDWRIENADKPYSEYVPVMADWTGNDYGMGDVLLESGSRWIGEVTSSTTEFTFNPEEEQYTAVMVANIKYTAWTKDQGKLEKTGTLTLNLVPNLNQLNESGHKVLISSASLKVDG